MTQSLTPRAAILLLIATALYLIFELGFNARLLDVAGHPSNIDAIRGIEQWGRLISGVAVALAAWGMLAQWFNKNHWHGCGLSLAILALTLVTVPAVYFLERAMVDAEVERSRAEDRQLAALAVVATDYLHTHRNIEGIPLDADTFERPEGMAFYALFASLYGSVLRSMPDIGPVLRAAVNTAVLSEIGSDAKTYNDIYIPAVEEIHTLYSRDYVPAMNAYADAIEGAGRESANAWQRYEAALRRQNWTPERVPERYWGRVRREVRQQIGVNVPDNWAPYDRYTFETLVRQRVRNAANEQWNSRSATFFSGAPAPRTAETFEQFFALSQVQERLKNGLKLTDYSGRVLNTWTLDQWRRIWHEPTIKREADALYHAIREDTPSFERGAANYCRGVDATHAYAVPRLALSISIIGAIYHSGKVLWYLCYLIPMLRGSAARWGIRIVFSALVLAAPYAFGADNAIINTEGYANLLQYKAMQDGVLSAWLHDWIIRAQQIYYPLNAAVHEHVLRGFEFTPLFGAHECH